MSLMEERDVIRADIDDYIENGVRDTHTIRRMLEEYSRRSYKIGDLHIKNMNPRLWEQTMEDLRIVQGSVNRRLRSIQEQKNAEPSSDDDTEDHTPRRPPQPAARQNRAESMDIAEVVRATIEATRGTSSTSKGKVKPVSIPEYRGKTSLTEFLDTFDGLIPEADSGTVKILRLKESCKGQAFDLIERLPNSDNGYGAARKLLKETFGGREKDTQRYLRDAREYQKIKLSEQGSIRKFRNFVQSLVSSIQGTSSDSELGEGSLYAILLDKLPDMKKSHYFRWLEDDDRDASVKSLNLWLSRESKIEQRLHRSSRRKECPKFQQFDYNTRWNCAKALRMCYRCLIPGHSGNECRKSQNCDINGCRASHHRLLHNYRPKNDERVRNHRESNVYHSHKYTPYAEPQNSANSLRTLPVWVIANGIRLKINCCLDDGSTNTFVSEDLVRRLGIKPNLSPLRVSTLNDSSSFMQSGMVEFTVADLPKRFSTTIRAHTCPKPPMGDYRPIDWTELKFQYSHLLACDFKPPNRPLRIDLLIGTSEAQLHRSKIEYAGPPGTPIARLTPLGWSAVGPTGQTVSHNRSFFSFPTYVTETPSTEEVMKSFEKMWESEPLIMKSPNPPVLKPNEKTALSIMSESLTHDGTRYKIAVPWARNPAETLSNNFHYAKKRLDGLRRTFARRPELRAQYDKIFTDYESAGFIKRVPLETDKNADVFYLPHFAVLRDDRATTKVRPVFDGAAKYKALCLNDMIYDCPNLQSNLFDVLLRFRKHKVALSCDIQKMYLQIRIPETDTRYFRFLWERDNELVAYAFQVVVFGSKCAPAQAIYVSQENARRHQTEFPRAAEAVLTETYMDDVLSSVENDTAAIELYKSLVKLWTKAGMTPHKWLSNSSVVMRAIGNETATPLEFKPDSNPSTKVLGQKWNPIPDEFQPFTTLKPVLPDTVLTLSNTLSYIATTYDPLGFVAPVIVAGRMLIQDLHRLKLDYKDPLPTALNSKFAAWVNSLSSISELSFDRCLMPYPDSPTELLIFSDASERAMCAVAYMRTVTAETVHIRFAASKTQICPMEPRSIPESELTACHIGALLAYRICEALKMDLSAVTFFTDSVDAIWWIRGSVASEFRPYVKNKINAIQSLTDSHQWKHVRGIFNPADIGSRGCNAATLVHAELWKHGPPWLIEPEKSKWPSLDQLPDLDHELPHKRSITARMRSNFAHADPASLLSHLINDRSGLHDSTRTLCWINRFIRNCRSSKDDRNLEAEPTADEYTEAESMLIKHAQTVDFDDEIKTLRTNKPLPQKSELAKFQPFLDGEGLLRVGGRLHYADHVPFDAKHPIILSGTNRISRLLIERSHSKRNHTRGITQLLALVNQKYWITGGPKLAKSVIEKCVLCQKMAKLPSRPKMAPLVAERTMGSYPFQYTGCDLAGPFLCSTGPRRSPVKRWVIVWTCLTTRAVRLDIVTDLSEKAFLRAFIRFRSRNNEPASISSDNGTNFVSAAKTLKTEAPKLKWKLISPASPNFGGAWEVMVREMKKALMKTLDIYRMYEEELQTALAQIEQTLNLRPLTALTDNPDDLQVLTPQSFLTEQQQVAVESDIESPHLGQRWKLLQEVLKQAWQRFLKEFLSKQNQIPKWRKSRRPIREGDLVIVMRHDTPRFHWPYGIVSQVFKRPSDDVRVAVVRMADRKLVTRPATKLIPIDVDA